MDRSTVCPTSDGDNPAGFEFRATNTSEALQNPFRPQISCVLSEEKICAHIQTGYTSPQSLLHKGAGRKIPVVITGFNSTLSEMSPNSSQSSHDGSPQVSALGRTLC
jgi:hypothetical protein